MEEALFRIRVPRPLIWALVLIVVVATFAIGYWGYAEYRPPGSIGGEGRLDLAYYTLQLFGLEFNGRANTEVPASLQIARVLAPIALTGTVVAAFMFVRASLWWRRTTKRQYAIVIGDTAEARAVAAAIRAVSRRAVFEAPKGDVATLRSYGVSKARVVYALGEGRDDVAANVALALDSPLPAGWPRRRRAAPRVFVHVTDPDLAIGLHARQLMTRHDSPTPRGDHRRARSRVPRVEFFTMDDVAARAHVGEHPFDGEARPEILVAGGGAFGRAIAVEFTRRWRAEHPADRVRLTLVDANASRVRARILDQWPVVAQHCDITAVETDDLAAVVHSAQLGHPYRAYIGYDDEKEALKAALAAVPLWHGGPASLVVRLSQLTQHATAFEDGGLLDNLGGRLAVAQVARLAAPVVAADEEWGIYTRLAPRIHASYQRLVRAGGIDDDRFTQDWEKLSQDARESNYAQARHLGAKLAAVGATIAPWSSQNASIELTAFTDDEVEMLAEMEHERWVRERRSRGWHKGRRRNSRRKRHPDLVAWKDLPERSRNLDREFVRRIPEVYGDTLADYGMQIIRPGRLASADGARRDDG